MEEMKEGRKGLRKNNKEEREAQRDAGKEGRK